MCFAGSSLFALRERPLGGHLVNQAPTMEGEWGSGQKDRPLRSRVRSGVRSSGSTIRVLSIYLQSSLSSFVTLHVHDMYLIMLHLHIRVPPPPGTSLHQLRIPQLSFKSSPFIIGLSYATKTLQAITSSSKLHTDSLTR